MVFIVVPQSRRKAPSKKARKADDLDDLKQELDIDFHKITPEELYQRFQTHPENVSQIQIFTGIQFLPNIHQNPYNLFKIHFFFFFNAIHGFRKLVIIVMEPAVV